MRLHTGIASRRASAAAKAPKGKPQVFTTARAVHLPGDQSDIAIGALTQDNCDRSAPRRPAPQKMNLHRKTREAEPGNYMWRGQGYKNTRDVATVLRSNLRRSIHRF